MNAFDYHIVTFVNQFARRSWIFDFLVELTTNNYLLRTGLLMALFYAFSLEPYLPRSTAAKGWIYAIAVWLLNACVVLPTSGEGFAGSAHLTAAGMLWYAASHTLFFLTLAYGFALMVREPKPA